MIEEVFWQARGAAAVLKIVPEGRPNFIIGGFVWSGNGDLNPRDYNFLCCAIVETLLTFFIFAGH